VKLRAAFVGAIGLVVLAVALVLVGRWEEARSARDEMHEMRIVLNAVGDLARRRPTGYRIGPPDCLSYATPKNLYGLQICFDRTGRVVETVDRRPTQPKYASLAYDPALSTLRVPLALVDKLFALKRIPAG
jgi:pentatricopeptide repeat protein